MTGRNLGPSAQFHDAAGYRGERRKVEGNPAFVNGLAGEVMGIEGWPPSFCGLWHIEPDMLTERHDARCASIHQQVDKQPIKPLIRLISLCLAQFFDFPISEINWQTAPIIKAFARPRVLVA